MSAEAERLEVRDLVVVLPGILGSTLARDGQQVWAPSSGAVWQAIRSFGASIQPSPSPLTWAMTLLAMRLNRWR